jgi:thiamine-phosphate pyrophosphorylase
VRRWSCRPQAKAELGLPVCAIGGITLQNAPQLIAAGADLLAVITDLFEAPDIRARAAAFTSLFQERVTS